MKISSYALQLAKAWTDISLVESDVAKQFEFQARRCRVRPRYLLTRALFLLVEIQPIARFKGFGETKIDVLATLGCGHDSIALIVPN
jgi:hypothetical protein